MNLYLQDTNVALERIFQKEINVCVVGVGTIGLPLATFLAKSGFNVTGLDISQKRVDDVNRGEVTFEYSDILKKSVSEKKLIAEVLNDGEISDNKGINIPDAILPISSLTSKDESKLK